MGSSWPVYGALIVLSGLMIGAMVYVLRTGTRMSVRHVPLVDAAMELRLEATSAHLWFEEILSGDRNETMDEVWRHLDSADWYARAMLEGGTNPEGTYFPLQDPRLRVEIEEVRSRLADFRAITSQRWTARLVSAAGTDIDQRYDEVFHGFLGLAAHVETEVRKTIAVEIRNFRRAQLSLIAGAALLTALTAIALARYNTAHARAEAHVDELRERLTHVTRVGTVGEMATGIAHEINQPLTAIATVSQTCTRLLENGQTNPADMREAMAGITTQALRAGDVIRNLRSLVRGGQSERDVVDVNQLVRDVVKLAKGHVQQHGCRTQLDLAPKLPPALADRVQIQQVVLNLIRNGMDALDGGGRGDDEITVVTRANGHEEVEVQVIDRGVGLSDEAAEQLFNPFFTTKEAGLGMGLSICWSIVTSHGGKLWYSRNNGRGTTLHFTLPTAGASSS